MQCVMLQIGQVRLENNLRKFLVVMDNTPEFLNALRFAATRASKTGGAVEILGIIGPEEFQHWLGVGETMRAEARERIEPELIIREGERVTEILGQIKDDPEVGILVLGANPSGDGPGPLVSQLVGRQGGVLPVPVTIVPGSMTKEAIDAVS
jgi:hypothetical protein